MTGNLCNLYQIKVSLNGVKPPIWRRLVISGATDLIELHENNPDCDGVDGLTFASVCRWK